MSTIFHVDMDAFYASVEQRDTPSLRGQPVIVGGNGNRGVVAACSYESRRFGVHSAMPIRQALRLCPQAIVVPVRMARYQEVSRLIMARFADYSPSVHAISIDEAFLDMTGTERLLGPSREVAARLKADIVGTTGLTISVGIGSSHFIAKLASDVDKPDGLYEVAPGDEADFVASLPLRKLWGLGERTRQRLEQLGITTVEALRAQRIEFLRGHFGAASGAFLYQIARGEDPGVYRTSHGRHSISAEETFENDISAAAELHRQLRLLADEVFHRSIREQWRGQTITVKFRFPPFETHTASRTLSRVVETSDELAEIAVSLLESRRAGRPLRLIGLGISGDAQGGETAQGDLFADEERSTALDPTIVALRERFGPAAIARASTTEPNPSRHLPGSD